MAKQFSAVLAAAASVALISISASTYAAWGESAHPFSVNDTGPVLTAKQRQYQEQQDAMRQQAQGVAGRPGLAEGERGESAFYEVQTPSRGGPIDD